MNPSAQLLNVIDVEATCWDGEVPAGAVSEIIEIGLTVVDIGTRERLGKHRILVRPARSAVSPFCTELTGLTQAEVDTGIDFAAACRLLVTEHDAKVRPWASWGDYDRKQFIAQCQATGVAYPFSPTHTNAKIVFSEAYHLRRRQGMAAALHVAGIPLEGRHHSGADDAWNIGALVLDLLNRHAWRVTTQTARLT